jgi:aminopeptidase-like protein
MHRTARTYFDICQAHEINQNYKSLNPHCEPQLGKRNLYNNLSTKQQTAQTNQHIMWLLAYADGNTPLIEIAQKAQCNILNFQPTIALLQQNGLLE